MARLARTIIPGVEHHVTQRGNNRQDVLFAADDRRSYLELLAEKCEMHGLAVVAYCLRTTCTWWRCRKTKTARRWGRRISGTRDTSTACTAVAGIYGRTGSSRVRWGQAT